MIYFLSPGNGQVDFNEFIDLMLELENPELDQQSYLETFRAFDNTNKGYIQSSLIREILFDVMGKREKEREHVIRVFQLDKDRRVTYPGRILLLFIVIIINTLFYNVGIKKVYNSYTCIKIFTSIANKNQLIQIAKTKWIENIMLNKPKT